MSNINQILNDESNNDKALIRELSIFIANHKRNKLPINRAFVKSLTDIVLRNSEVDFKNINFSSNFNFLAQWVGSEKTLEYDITKISGYSKKFRKNWLHSKNGDNRLFAYFWILTSVIHEITHTRQYYLEEKANHEIYSSTNNFIENNYSQYTENHDIMLNERYANLRGNILTYDVLSYIYPIDQIERIRVLIFHKLLHGYKTVIEGKEINAGIYCKSKPISKIITALDSYNRLMEENLLPKVQIDYPSDMELYDRFYLGLDITFPEYVKIFNIYRDIYYGTGSKESVKTLIRK